MQQPCVLMVLTRNGVIVNEHWLSQKLHTTIFKLKDLLCPCHSTIHPYFIPSHEKTVYNDHHHPPAVEHPCDSLVFWMSLIKSNYSTTSQRQVPCCYCVIQVKTVYSGENNPTTSNLGHLDLETGQSSALARKREYFGTNQSSRIAWDWRIWGRDAQATKAPCAASGPPIVGAG